MKKVFALALCLAVSIGMVACGPSEPQITPEEQIAQNATTGTIAVEIVKAEVAKNMDGADAVVVTYKFSNNTNKERDFKTSTKCKVMQGENALKSTTVPVGDIYKEGVATKMIKAGETIDVQMCYTLADTTTPLKISCKIESGEDKSTVDKELPIA